ncbi:hypothetical protein AK88_04720, partial [Plasmodium fragile]
ILEHLQRGELPPPDYGYTLIRDRQPASTSARGQRPPRVHKRTIIELHLEVLHECEATEWENVKDDYLQILVEAFAQELMRDEATNNNILVVSTADQGPPGINVSSTVDTPTDADGTHTSPPNDEDPDPWSCMQHIQLETDPCLPHEQDPDPWKCMETIHLEQQTSHSQPAATNATSAPDHINWITWIDRNKHLLRACTGQPWFLQLKADWTQHVREHMVADAASGEHRTAATLERKKLDLWKAWVAKQHALMHIY